MKKIIFFLISLCFCFLCIIFCFSNGSIERCVNLEQEIMKNPNVVSVDVGQYDKWAEEVYYAYVFLKNGGYLGLTNFDKNLSGEFLGVLYVGKNPDGKVEYYYADAFIITRNPYRAAGMNEFRCKAMTAVFQKSIFTVDDIINNYDEIYAFTEKLAKETPEERSKRRNRTQTQDDQNFTDKLGNFENDECWGQVFAQTFSLDNYMGRGEPLFADE